MQYVPFGDLGFNISRLGFGMMRLPKVTLPDGSTALDEARATAMLRSAIDQGLSYVDTAYPYCDGQSEPLVGRILKDGYRERVKLATKLPVWKMETRQDMDAVLDEQLKRLDVPYVDFYLLHALGRERWEKMKALGVREFLDSAVKDGRIRYPAFSFHDDYEVFRDILTSYDWRMAQIQFNYLDIRHQAGLRGIAAKHRAGVYQCGFNAQARASFSGADACHAASDNHHVKIRRLIFRTYRHNLHLIRYQLRC